MTLTVNRSRVWRAALSVLAVAAFAGLAPWASPATAAPTPEATGSPVGGEQAALDGEDVEPAATELEPTEVPALTGHAVAQAEATRFSRFAGVDRYDTARNLYLGGWWNREALVVASGENYADALAATPFAAAHNIPIVLVGNGHIPAPTAEVFRTAREKGANRVYLVGGTNVMTAQLRAQIRSYGFDIAQHFGGADRYVTAQGLAFATAEVYRNSGAPLQKVFLVDGTNFADALAVGPAAAANRGVILLTAGSRVPQSTWYALSKLHGERHAIGGGPVAAFKYNADGLVAGTDRYETAVQVARTYLPNVPEVYVASGQTFPDALAGGALAANKSASLVLCRRDDVPLTVQQYLPPRKFAHLSVLGGYGSISQDVIDFLVNTVGK
ncbi:cell wall-binding repeat-containing protein [Buchananella felis]|uniref:cell wall-binding repeat-containing protein n=1 Tax=Buchananella felis TaxID=3231492 RepID=UPI00352854F7